MKYHSIFILGAPIKDTDREVYQKAVKERFRGDLEKATEYVQKAADRQITKSAGILSSTSILAGISYFVHAKTPLLLALVALLLSLASFYSKWSSDVEVFKNPEADFENTVHICYNRSIFNNISTFLLFITVVFLVFDLLV